MKRFWYLASLATLLFVIPFFAGKQLGSADPASLEGDTLAADFKERQNQSSSLQTYQRMQDTTSLGQYYVVVPPAAFTSDGMNPDAFRIDSDYGYLHGLYGPSYLWAPLYLPSDAMIRSVEVSLEDWDAHPGHDVCIYLDRMNLETGDYECCLAAICSYGGDGEYVSLAENTISAPEVNNYYAYQLNIYGLYPETYIFGLRVGYSFSQHLPIVVGK